MSPIYLIALGMLLMAAYASLDAYIRMRVRDLGYPVSMWTRSPANASTPFKYVKHHKEQRWSLWPVLLLLPSLALGITLLILGTSQLH
jgi:hypothetical protein